MDISTLKEVGARKRTKIDAENLKAKLSAETSKIIKLKVKQDAAYWELREKLASTERNHERLQQNMVELQMQYETVSAQYQEEMRRRPEVINNLMSNRKIYDVLEDNMNRIRATLQRSAADRTALAEAYAQASEKVTAAQSEHEKRIAAAMNEARSAQERAKLKDEQCVRLSECMGMFNSRAEEANAELERMREQRDCLAEKMARYETHIQNQEKTIQDLREDMRRAANDYNERMERQRKAAAELEREAGAATALRESLAQAENRNEMLTRDSKRLSSELAVANEAAQRAAALKIQNQELSSNIEELKRNMSYLVNKSEDIVHELKVKTQKVQSLEEALTESKQETQSAAQRVSELVKEQERERREFEERVNTLTNEHANELERQREEQKQKLSTGIKKMAEEITRERNNFQDKILNYERDLTECNETIARLKLEIEEVTKTRHESNTAIAELNNTLKRERSEKDIRIADLERLLTEKLEMISRLEEQLGIEKENLLKTNTIIDEQKTELDRERKDFEDRKAAFEKQLADHEEANAQLQRDLAEEKEKLTSSEEALNTARVELNTARADAAHALDNVRRLEASVRTKDNEASNQMNMILAIRAEKEQLQEKIREMQNTINDIQKITHRRSPPLKPSEVARRDPPEQDLNTMALPSTPRRKIRAVTPMQPGRRLVTPTPAIDPQDPIYGIFSDTDSVDDPLDLNHRFDALVRGVPMPHNAVKRQRKQPKLTPQPPVAGPTDLMPQPQPEVQTEVRRKFFKSRRNRDEAKKN